MPGNASREVEVKLRVPSAGQQADLLLGLGYEVESARAFEANEVWDYPGETLRGRRELLRLREYAGQALVTFKGPPAGGARHRDREEIETTVADPAAMRAILQRLGLAVFFRYEKYRSLLRKPGEPGLVVVDETPIGDFLELEGPAEWIDATAAALGFHANDYVTDSYGRLYLKYCEDRGIHPTHMVFAR